VPVSDVRTDEIIAFVPVVDAVVFAGELIIAALLYAQAEVFRSRALALLASGFVFIALLLVPHALTFPGAFAPDGLLGAGTNSTAWIYIFRRLGFPITVIFYVVLKTTDEAAPPEARRPIIGAVPWVLGAVAFAVAMTCLALVGDHLLPPLFHNRSDANPFSLLVFNVSNIALVLVAMTVLFLNRKSVLDVWLQVALAGWLTQSALNLWVHARFTVGFYCMFLIILLSHLFVLLALMAESNRLYARLALAMAVRVRDRDRQMMSMEAVAATISHEVGQPLAAVTLNAAAGLRFLTRASPDAERATKSFRDIIDAGQRAFEVMKSVRASFTNGSGTLSEFELNDLVRETASLFARDIAAQKISLQLVLDEAQPPILANRVQMQRVLINLLSNAMEALAASGPHARRISIRSTTPPDENVLLEISDTGVGIPPEQAAQVFDPFFTTKSTGTGLGLSLSRDILEAHGGRLWVSPGQGRGATFHLLLPRGRPATRH
jgi:signal transduction histidine kinase